MPEGKNNDLTANESEPSKEEALKALEDLPFDEDDETPSEEETTESEEETESDEPDKSGAQKRIDKLTATVKNKQKEIDELNARHAEERDELVKEREFYEKEHKKLIASLTNWNTGTSKSLYEMSDDEFNDLKELFLDRTDIEDAEKIRIIKDAIRDRKEYKSKAAPLLKKQQALSQDDGKIWTNDWKSVQDILTDKETGDPDLLKYLDSFNQALGKDLQEDIYLYEKLQTGGVKAKLRYALKLIERLGVDQQLEAANYQNDRPELSAPVGRSKGAKSPTTGGRKTFTAEEIAKMSQKEYDQNEPAIKAWLKKEVQKSRK